MKKLLSLVMMLVMTLAVTPAEVRAQGLSKEERKAAKQAAKDLVKDGWKVQGLGTIESNMIKMMERQGMGETLLTGVALTGYKEDNAALSNCLTMAINEYMKTTGEGVVKGRVTSEVSRLGNSESSNIVDMAEQNFIKELKGELRSPTLKITRGSTANSDFQMQCWWLLNDDKISQIRERAIKQALADVDGASSVGEKISDFVNGR